MHERKDFNVVTQKKVLCRYVFKDEYDLMFTNLNLQMYNLCLHVSKNYLDVWILKICVSNIGTKIGDPKENLAYGACCPEQALSDSMPLIHWVKDAL